MDRDTIAKTASPILTNVGDLETVFDSLTARIERLLAERQQIVETLSRFYRSELSASSLQPVLTLAETLNPTLRHRCTHTRSYQGVTMPDGYCARCGRKVS